MQRKHTPWKKVENLVMSTVVERGPKLLTTFSTDATIWMLRRPTVISPFSCKTTLQETSTFQYLPWKPNPP